MKPLHKAILLHIFLSVCFIYLRPNYFFNDDGPNHFGTSKDCIPFPFYIVVTIITCISFILWSIFPSTL